MRNLIFLATVLSLLYSCDKAEAEDLSGTYVGEYYSRSVHQNGDVFEYTTIDTQFVRHRGNEISIDNKNFPVNGLRKYGSTEVSYPEGYQTLTFNGNQVSWYYEYDFSDGASSTQTFVGVKM